VWAIVVMVVCVVLFGGAALVRSGGQRSVLEVTRAVAAGTPISVADVRTVRLGRDVSGADGLTVSSADRSRVIGQTARIPLTAGSLLSPSDLGPSAWPPSGQSVVGLALKDGQFPTGLAAPDRVAVMLGGATAPVAAMVASVTPASDSSGTTVISLLVADGAVPAVTGASSPQLVELHPGGSDMP
jgi:hypothetical protein